jgi:cardiolipin synthase
MESLKNNSSAIIRGLTVAIAVLLQIAVFIILGGYLQEYATWVYVLLEIIGFIVVFALVNDQESYRQFWVIIVLVLPVLGLFLYFMWGRRRTNSKMNVMIRNTEEKMRAYSEQDLEIIQQLKENHPHKVQIANYLNGEGFRMYAHTKVRYFPLGEQMLDAMIEDMENATKCIFLEYFIVSEGEVWQRVKKVLIDKAQQGVDIRLLIDDFGCLAINTAEFRKELRSAGIRLAVFAPIHKDVDRLSFNYRNHQKITIIDGNIGYCGGINLADEYANMIERFGHWKDTAVRLEGDGVWGLTSIFLEMWEITMRYEITTDYRIYMPTVHPENDGYVQPFADGPANNPENPAEEAYTHMINKARDYIYITTPYLVLDNKMAEDLCRAARSGVEVRILVPQIYDKWYVYMVNVANYGRLLQNGVHIHEYIPGFIHSKTVVCDDECAICGTINTDFRSFYLHYECGVFMCDSSAVLAIRDDIRKTLERCDEMNYDDWNRRPLHLKLIQWVLKLFGPVL